MNPDEHDKLRKAAAAPELERLEKSFAAGGDRGAALHAIYLCFWADLEVPDWAQREFRIIYRAGLHGRLKRNDWFRPPRTKAQAERYFKQLMAMPKVWRMVLESDQPIGNSLFEKIGRELGIGGRSLTQALWNMRGQHRKKR